MNLRLSSAYPIAIFVVDYSHFRVSSSFELSLTVVKIEKGIEAHEWSENKKKSRFHEGSAFLRGGIPGTST